jgi:hypothetical protein
MASTGSVSVSAVELRDAFEFVSAGSLSEHCAYVCIDTGRIYWTSSMGDLTDEDLPEDLETSDRYIAVPHKHDLNLGRNLVLVFVDQELPDDCDTVRGFFRRKGAYGRFKGLLESRDMLEAWYTFEDNATKAALLGWSEENSIQLVDDV